MQLGARVNFLLAFTQWTLLSKGLDCYLTRRSLLTRMWPGARLKYFLFFFNHYIYEWIIPTQFGSYKNWLNKSEKSDYLGEVVWGSVSSRRPELLLGTDASASRAEIISSSCVSSISTVHVIRVSSMPLWHSITSLGTQLTLWWPCY